MKIKKLDFVEEKMVFERQNICVALIIPFFIILFFLVISISSYTGYFFGLKELDSVEKLERFYNSNFRLSNIEFNNIIDTKESFVVTTEYQDSITLLSAYGGGSIPTGERTKHNVYNVYILELNDANVILCTDEENNIDFTKNKVQVINQNKEINKNVIEEFSKYNTGDKELYVFYSAQAQEESNNVIIYEILVLLILFILIMIIRHSKFLRKRTKLGKQIRNIGDYDTIAKEINEQVKEAICESNGCVVCTDYILITIRNKTKIIQMKDVKSVISIPDENYPDEIFIIEIEYMEKSEIKNHKFQVYDKQTEEKVLKCISNGKGN